MNLLTLLLIALLFYFLFLARNLVLSFVVALLLVITLGMKREKRAPAPSGGGEQIVVKLKRTGTWPSFFAIQPDWHSWTNPESGLVWYSAQIGRFLKGAIKAFFRLVKGEIE